MKNQELIDYCRWNMAEKVQDLLSKAQEPVDILSQDGLIITLAIDNNQFEVLKALISYYENKILDGDPQSDEYLHKKELLRQAIENACDFTSNKISSAIEELINPYLLEDGSTTIEGEDTPIEQDNLPMLAKQDLYSRTDISAKPSIIVNSSIGGSSAYSANASTTVILTTESLKSSEEHNVSIKTSDGNERVLAFLDEILVGSREGTPEHGIQQESVELAGINTEDYGFEG